MQIDAYGDNRPGLKPRAYRQTRRTRAACSNQTYANADFIAVSAGL